MKQKKKNNNYFHSTPAKIVPKISVIMSVYNGEESIREAIQSILSQSFREFEFIIVDDGSTDNSLELIREYRDVRIELIVNRDNIGLPRSLNKAISVAKGEYIVRFDVDDVSLNNRLYEQYKFMEDNIDVGISGSWTKSIKHNGSMSICRYSKSSELLKCQLLFYNPLCHPTVIIRKFVLDEHKLRYNENYELAQDYELWSRAANFTKLGNINKVLLLYRENSGQISPQKRVRQLEYGNEIRCNLLNAIGVELSEYEMVIYKNIFSEFNRIDQYEIDLVAGLFMKIKKKCINSNKYSENYYNYAMSEFIYSLVVNKPVCDKSYYLKIIFSKIGMNMSLNIIFKIFYRYLKTRKLLNE